MKRFAYYCDLCGNNFPADDSRPGTALATARIWGSPHGWQHFSSGGVDQHICTDCCNILLNAEHLKIAQLDWAAILEQSGFTLTESGITKDGHPVVTFVTGV